MCEAGGGQSSLMLMAAAGQTCNAQSPNYLSTGGPNCAFFSRCYPRCRLAAAAARAPPSPCQRPSPCCCPNGFPSSRPNAKSLPAVQEAAAPAALTSSHRDAASTSAPGRSLPMGLEMFCKCVKRERGHFRSPQRVPATLGFPGAGGPHLCLGASL